MRVVCISNLTRRYHSNGDVYEVIDPFLKIGKSYETFMPPKEFENGSVVGLWDEESEDEIVGDRLYDKYLFISIEDWRDKQLNELLNV
jgi:hypothetical protein